MNEQKPEKQSKASILEVNKIFDTIQGEGPFSGHPATFIRLAGCNLQCIWCDTEYTTRVPMSRSEVVHRMRHKLVVITGGEPLRQNIVPLIKMLTDNGHLVQIETNGTMWIEGLEKTEAVIVISPKTIRLHPKMLEYHMCSSLSSIKLVVGNDAYPTQPGGKGGLVLTNFIDKKRSPDYIIPLDSGTPEENKENNRVAVRLTIDYNSKLQVQLHKIVGIE